MPSTRRRRDAARTYYICPLEPSRRRPGALSCECALAWQLLNQSLGPSANWDSGDFENVDGGYPMAGEHYGIAGTAVPSRSMEGWYPGTSCFLFSADSARQCVATCALVCVRKWHAFVRVRKWHAFGLVVVGGLPNAASLPPCLPPSFPPSLSRACALSLRVTFSRDYRDYHASHLPNTRINSLSLWLSLHQSSKISPGRGG